MQENRVLNEVHCIIFLSDIFLFTTRPTAATT